MKIRNMLVFPKNSAGTSGIKKAPYHGLLYPIGMWDTKKSFTIPELST